MSDCCLNFFCRCNRNSKTVKICVLLFFYLEFSFRKLKNTYGVQIHKQIQTFDYHNTKKGGKHFFTTFVSV